MRASRRPAPSRCPTWAPSRQRVSPRPAHRSPQAAAGADAAARSTGEPVRHGAREPAGIRHRRRRAAGAHRPHAPVPHHLRSAVGGRRDERARRRHGPVLSGRRLGLLRGPPVACRRARFGSRRNADRDRSQPSVASAEREPTLHPGRRGRCARRERRPLLRRRLGEHARRLRHLARHDGAGRPHRRRRCDVSADLTASSSGARSPAAPRSRSTSTWTGARGRPRTSRSRPATSSRCRPRRRRWCLLRVLVPHQRGPRRRGLVVPGF